MKHYGIYTAYPPTTDLVGQGLGRQLTAFLKGAEASGETIRFVVACPSWSKESILKLCALEGVNPAGFDIVCPSSRPFLLSVYVAIQRYKSRPPRVGYTARAIAFATNQAGIHRAWLETTMARARSSWVLVPLSAYVLIVSMLALPVVLALTVLGATRALFTSVTKRLRGLTLSRRLRERVGAVMGNPKDDGLVLRLFKAMEERESELLVETINRLTHVVAWYSPAAFWPWFNQIEAPTLMCVPDVVLTEFPIGYADVGGDRYLDTFQSVEKAIRGCRSFVTYSEHVKWQTLVRRYSVDPALVHVVNHAPQQLKASITVHGFADSEATARHYCEVLFSAALNHSAFPNHTGGFQSSTPRFIFYASQFRPHKNVLSLLRAYNYLLRKRFFSHKLVLTGDPKAMPDVATFIAENRLERDVVFLVGISVAELAACYRLADLAVNPSLSEGGCPFTFTEALSVGTPVVMAKIPVTTELLSCPELGKHMYFDPFDWKDMAHRIEWALSHRAELLELQRPAFDRLVKRSWNDVVAEYVAIMDQLVDARNHKIRPPLPITNAADSSRNILPPDFLSVEASAQSTHSKTAR